jgi:Flp pilus assembly protein protease CpaA
VTQAIIFVVFPLCLAVAACSDFLTMLIPNRVSAILLATFVIVAPLAGLGLTDIAASSSSPCALRTSPSTSWVAAMPSF